MGSVDNDISCEPPAAPPPASDHDPVAGDDMASWLRAMADEVYATALGWLADLGHSEDVSHEAVLHAGYYYGKLNKHSPTSSPTPTPTSPILATLAGADSLTSGTSKPRGLSAPPVATDVERVAFWGGAELQGRGGWAAAPGEGESGCRGEEEVGWRRCCDNPPRKIPYYRLNQSTLTIKRQ
jgi:hypothetical protein